MHERKAFFVAGLAPTKRVDVSEYCPAGAVAVSEETTFVDGLFSFFTLSIYTPRSSTFYCAAESE
ncbi:MAG: Bor family protein [Myxococcota bacterium]